MASFRAISAVATSLLRQLELAWDRDGFTSDTFETAFLHGSNDESAPAFGMSAHLLRVNVNGLQRTSPPLAERHRRPLPVELELVLAPWATTAARMAELLGWTMRAIDDAPILAPAELNVTSPDTFLPSELVELVPITLPLDEHLRLWEALPWPRRTAVAYQARLLRIDSSRTVDEAGPVLERDMAFADVGRRP
jgi:hypothetical protein